MSKFNYVMSNVQCHIYARTSVPRQVNNKNTYDVIVSLFDDICPVNRINDINWTYK